MTIDQSQPNNLETFVTYNANKAKSGVKSNAYIIFDYHSPTDFKYAGVEVGLTQVQIGKRTPTGWTNLAQAQLRLDALVDQQLKLILNGDTAILQVNGATQ